MHYCLGITIAYTVGESLEQHQKQYIEKMLKNYQLEYLKDVSTPADPNVTLLKDDGFSKAVKPVVYQSMIGILLYAAFGRKSNISLAVGVSSKFRSMPAEAHLTAVKRIYRNLKGSLKVTLKYKKSRYAQLIGYTNTDYAGYLNDRHSTTRNMFVMSDGLVSLFSKKQSIVTFCIAEPEYVALSTVTQETTRIRRLLSDFHVPLEQASMIMEHNHSAICIARYPVMHTKPKHVNICYH